MSNRWPQTPLGELLTRSEETTSPSPDAEYREVTVKLWGRGVVQRGVVTGATIAGQRRFIVRRGQFILSRIDARNGALGLVPSDLDGAVVSNDFPVFDISQTRLSPEYLGWMCRTASFVEECRRASEGTTNRVRLQETKFLAREIPLPPLSEQQQIVARIEEIAAEVQHARELRAGAAIDARMLLTEYVGEVFDQLSRRCRSRPFGSFSPHVTSGPRNWAKHYEESSALRFYRAQDIGAEGNILDGSKVFITPPPGEQGRSAMLLPGDVMLVITGATVGRASVFREHLAPGFVSQHVAICRLPRDEVDPDFVLCGLRGPAGQSQLLGQRYGQGKPGLNLANIRALSLPFPGLAEQRETVARLNAMQAEVDALRCLQDETAAELDALIPAILDRAFKGKL